jgi:signal transduction histidine kinase
MWSTLQIIFVLLGILLAFGGDRLSMPVLTNLGVACFGLASIAIGWEAILTRHIKLGSRRRGTRETYTGLAAILHGIQFNLLGLFLIGLGLFFDFSAGREVFLQFVRRPGLLLMLVGSLLIMQAIIALSGSLEERQGPRWGVIMNLVISRLLPGIILVVIGLGAIGLGMFEFVAPAAFDQMGGGFLETLYGLR